MAHKDVTLPLVNLSSEVRDVSSGIFVGHGLDILPSCVDFCLFCTLRGNLCHVFAHDPIIKALSREEMQPPTIPEVLCFSLNTIDFPGPRRRKLGERIIIQTTQTPHLNKSTSVRSLRRFKPTPSEADRAEATCVLSRSISAAASELGFNMPRYTAATDP